MVLGAPPQSPVPDAVSATERLTARAPGEPVLADGLSEPQLAVVRALVDLDANIPWHAHGLPPTAAGRRRLLGLTPAGPSETPVAYAGGERPLAFVFRHLQWREARGDDRAVAEREAMIASLSPVARLALFLDRFAHGLNIGVRGVTRGVPALPHDWRMAPLLEAAIAADRRGARAAVDALVALRERVGFGSELVRAVHATRDLGESIDAALLDQIADDGLGAAGDLLDAFPREAIERRLDRALARLLDAALSSDAWQIGVDAKVTALAPLLRYGASPAAVRSMLVLGWASGQPAAVRKAAGEHATAAPLAPVLVEYDALPQFTGWPAAKEGLRAFLAGPAPS
jgi:hypothetical protein